MIGDPMVGLDEEIRRRLGGGFNDTKAGHERSLDRKANGGVLFRIIKVL